MLAMLYLHNLARELADRNRPVTHKMIDVVVAVRDLPFGTKVDNKTMAVRHIPTTYAPSDAILASEYDAYKGRVLAVPIKAGTPLQKMMLVDQVPLDFSDTIPMQRRGLTIQVNDLNGFAGLLRPGDHVDLFVLLSGALNSSQGQGKQLLPVVQNVRVMATGRVSQHAYVDKLLLAGSGQRAGYDDHFTTVTVDVSPRQAALVALARDKGELVALLRNRTDKGLAKFTALTPAALLSNAGDMYQKARVASESNSLDRVAKNAKGQLVTPSGRVVTDPNVVMKNGVVMTKKGVVLTGRGLQVGSDGKIYTASGDPVDTAHLAQNKNGSLVAPGGVVIPSNGLVTKPNGEVQSVTGGKLNKQGYIIGPNGEVKTPSGVVLHGVKVNKNGEVVGADGKPLPKSSTLHLGEHGEVLTANGKPVAGVRGTPAPSTAVSGGLVESAGLDWVIQYIIGGTGENGVTPIKDVPVNP
ncbi:MAG: Flp pilus assembly protein CpaB [Gammaproteobacteria bacterium]